MAEIKVKKDNRVLDILESDKDAFLAEGYDVIDANGEVLERATGGRTYTAAEYNALLAENVKLSEQVKQLKSKSKAKQE